jgi:hypothetical protein
MVFMTIGVMTAVVDFSFSAVRIGNGVVAVSEEGGTATESDNVFVKLGRQINIQITRRN